MQEDERPGSSCGSVEGVVFFWWLWRVGYEVVFFWLMRDR